MQKLILFVAILLTGSANAMTYTQEKVNNKTCDVVTWTDTNGKARSVALVRADGDVNKHNGGYIERYSFRGRHRTHRIAWNRGQGRYRAWALRSIITTRPRPAARS
jgi:hypothetical protein